MAWLKKDHWNGGYTVHGVGEDILKAQKEQQFRDGMGQVLPQFQQNVANDAASSVRATAGILAGGVGIGVGMAKSRAFRYRVQVILHFLMGFMLIAGIAAGMMLPGLMADNPNAGPEVHLALAGKCLLIGLIGSAVWTGIYVKFRTIPKLRALQGR